MDAPFPLRVHPAALSPVFHTAAPAAHFVDAPFDNEQILPFTADKNADELAVIIKRKLIQLDMPVCQRLKVRCRAPASPDI